MSKNGGQMTRNMAENNIDKKIGGRLSENSDSYRMKKG